MATVAKTEGEIVFFQALGPQISMLLEINSANFHEPIIQKTY